ncbi:MAG: YcaO-like family protein [Nitrososphaeraceae archaeon]
MIEIQVLKMNNLFRGVSNKVGIVKNVFEVLREVDDPRLFYTIAFLSNIYENTKSSDEASSGAGFTLSDSINRTLGEAYERYALDSYEPENIILKRYKSIKNEFNTMGPKDLFFFSEEQYSSKKFRFSRFDEDTNIGWVKGFSLFNGEICFFPAQMIYFGYKIKPNESEICYSTSSGCAAGKSYLESIIKGIYEVVERDAVMLTWYKKITHNNINLNSSQSLNNLFKKYFYYPNIEYKLLYAEVGLDIPVIIGLALDNVNHTCKFNMGAASNLNPYYAAEKALLEVGQGRPYLKYLCANTSSYITELKEIENFLDSLRFYAHPNNFHYVEFLTQSDHAINFHDIPDRSGNNIKYDISTLCNLLLKHKCHPYVFDLTPNDLKEIGVFVTRVVISELVPFSSPMYPYYGHPRFRISIPNANYSKNYLNNLPHPFP